ncbi:HAD family hydrolase [Actibacterium lipolyticum]|uniref:6-phosphogluconate phosphatase n=1 Tax=Actibacterium lipolyticum TaxID=1524263 RepID=A0A238JJ74_9RHOB|nr:HAD family phosphatase [Actibacterium lipolyticum]SMX30721.1 6-phosphogluconate phosphatase [Actibacterium lipolyticum]
MTPKAVIFDCDGVLVDSEPQSNVILVENLKRHGLPLTQDECEHLFIGGAMRSVGDRAREMGADLPDNWIDEIYSEIYASLRQGTPKVQGIDTVLDRLDAANIPYAVGSNGSEEKMDITLGQTGLKQRFGGRIFSAHTYETAKPDPQLFLIAAKALGVAATDCAVVDDSPAGCIAARRAGMRCFGFAERTAPDRLADEGAEPVASMADLLAKLGV